MFSRRYLTKISFENLKTLRASERVKAIIDLSKFVLPTLKATEMSLSNETKFQAIEIELK